MSSQEVVETKLDILINDFKRFRQNIVGFIIIIVLPFFIYIMDHIIISGVR